MQLIRQKRITPVIIAVVLATSILLPVIISRMASAAALTQVMVRFDRMKTSTGTTGTVCAKPASTATEGKVVVTFPTNFVLGAYTTFTVNSTASNWPSGAQSWVTIAAPTGAGDIVGQAVSFGSGDLVAGTLYCFNWTNTAAVTTPASTSTTATGAVATQTAASAAIDSATYTTNVISDDQIQVSATVPQSFVFTLSGNSDAFGNLAAGSVVSGATPRYVQIDSNVKNGWQVWARDTNTGLNSSSAAHTIPSRTPGTVSTLTSGTEGYNTGVVRTQGSGAGTVTVDAAFDAGVTPYKGGGLDVTLRTLGSSNGTAQGDRLTLTNNASISSLTPAAADYTDVITVVGAGLF